MSYVNQKIRTVRSRVAIATINAGASVVVPCPTGKKLRLVDAWAVSVGGAAGAVTTVDILGTQATASVKLVAYAQASLTQSTVLKAGGSGATVLADGASFAANDINTSISISKTGASITTATHIDVLVSYTIED